MITEQAVWIDIHGCEVDALALFMNIASKRQPSKQESAVVMAIPWIEGLRELKGLVIDIKVESIGAMIRERRFNWV